MTEVNPQSRELTKTRAVAVLLPKHNWNRNGKKMNMWRVDVHDFVFAESSLHSVQIRNKHNTIRQVSCQATRVKSKCTPRYGFTATHILNHKHKHVTYAMLLNPCETKASTPKCGTSAWQACATPKCTTSAWRAYRSTRRLSGISRSCGTLHEETRTHKQLSWRWVYDQHIHTFQTIGPWENVL